MSDLVKKKGILIFKRRLTAINEDISDKQPYKCVLIAVSCEITRSSSRIRKGKSEVVN